MEPEKSEEEAYERLREFLDGLPAGLPASESGVELRVLRKLFTPVEAELAVQLRYLPEPVGVIAERWGLPEAEAAEKLASMARPRPHPQRRQRKEHLLSGGPVPPGDIRIPGRQHR